MIIVLLLISLSLYLHIAIGVANLKHFETLSEVSETSTIKRSADGGRDIFKHVMFRAFDRNFDLTLKSGTSLLSKDFRASLVHRDGSSTALTLDESLIFSGHLTDKPDVLVHAHVEETLWYIHVYDPQDIYAVEPAWRLLKPTDNPRNDTLIAYRASDLKSDSFNSSQFCGMNIHRKVERHHPRPNTTQTPDSHRGKDPGTSGRRDKRLSDTGLSCTLYLVGDYTFFKGRCKDNHQACLALMVAYVQMADTIFRTTVFANADSGIVYDVGLEIEELMLFSWYSTPAGKLTRHFNERREWSVGSKLDAFAEYVGVMTYHKKFCTSHLFTDYPFAMRVLGLAWMSTICMEARHGAIRKNSGLTSGTENAEGSIPSLQMNLVFVHELGHNFGSEHDPGTPECSIPDHLGGNYLMWEKSVSGKSPNNLKFSPCSKRYISHVLSHASCLVPRSSSVAFCGNGMVDQKEQCDAGAYGVIDTNPCCTSDCKLRAHATCSDLNQPCCRNCTMSPAGTMCIDKDIIECEDASYCTGKSYECPHPAYLEDWTICQDKGQCYRGICRSFCDTISVKHGLNLKGCFCQTNENGAACKWCCYDATDPSKPGPCLVQTNETVKDGRPCYLGICQRGVCQSHYVSTILRLTRYLPPMSVSKLGNFMKSNVVATVIFLSMIVWLPPVIFVYLKDKREQSLYPPLTIHYETDVHRPRTSESRARRQKRKKKREMKEAARQRIRAPSFLFELTANEAPSQKRPSLSPKKQFTWDQAQ